MSKLYAHIEYLSQQIKQLIAHNNEQKDKLQKLQQENEQLKQKMQLQNKQAISESKKTNKEVIRKWFINPSQANTNKMLSHYIKTLDECIHFLESFQ